MKRELVLAFGKEFAVSSKLFSIFFGTDLKQYLTEWLEKEVEIIGKQNETGEICEVNHEEIVLCSGTDQSHIRFEDICTITTKQ
ncbi:hypothetical protein QUF99_09300 [Bacillus sp. DX4.1]|uniref:hypothetical protein n=1 Tax=Bacillus sp. DX4.1 TaxID=3055867 RepID=UPI0025A0FF7C|nr:hypothetical protein [Bacillus sp. DX4.1]MDM5187510.1 hypothetical protein [Bacillus sp. DX4.1]